MEWALIALTIVLVVVAIIRFVNSESKPVYRRRPMLTKHEMVMLDRLEQALEKVGQPLAICPQVAMSAIIDVESDLKNGDRMSARNRIDRKVCDFVIIDRGSNPLIVIELDDWSHDNKQDNDRQRDQWLRDAGIHTLRYRKAHRVKVEQITQDIMECLQS